MKKILTATLTCLVFGLVAASASAVTLNFNSQGYGFNSLESGGSFTWANIGGSGIDLNWAIGGNSGDVNDSPSGTGLRIGRNIGVASGANHDYIFTFSLAVANVQFSILNINHGPQGSFQYYDLLTFTGAPSFSGLAGGVSSAGNQLIPAFGTANSQMATVGYAGPTNGFTITHGNGPNNVDPGFLIFPNISFDPVSVPEPSSVLLMGLGLVGVLRRRRA